MWLNKLLVKYMGMHGRRHEVRNAKLIAALNTMGV